LFQNEKKKKVTTWKKLNLKFKEQHEGKDGKKKNHKYV
jgi:hypothetical protein